MRGLDPALGKQKSSLGRLGLHTHTASTQQLSRLWGRVVCKAGEELPGTRCHRLTAGWETFKAGRRWESFNGYK